MAPGLCSGSGGLFTSSAPLTVRRYVRKWIKGRADLQSYKSSALCPLRAAKGNPETCRSWFKLVEEVVQRLHAASEDPNDPTVLQLGLRSGGLWWPLRAQLSCQAWGRHLQGGWGEPGPQWGEPGPPHAHHIPFATGARWCLPLGYLQ